MDAKNNSTDQRTLSRLLSYIGIFLLGTTLCVYSVFAFKLCFTRELDIYILPVFISFFAFLAFTYYLSQRKEKECHYLIYFFALFLLLCLRSPQDVYTPYLWGEDGEVLLKGSVEFGPSALFKVFAGTFWVIQRAISLVCYEICVVFRNLTYYPQMQGIICKLIGTASISYFLNERFSWLVKERFFRFIICACVIFSIPFYASDVIICDTSVPFYMNFTVFLIGLDTLCKKESRPITIPETVFLCILSISSAAAPFAAAIAFFSFLRWIFVKRESLPTKGKIALEAAKMCLVCACALIQVICIMQSSRTANEWKLLTRIIICLKGLVYAPYFYSYASWGVSLLGLCGFAALAYFSKVPWKIVAYTAVFSFGFLLYSSMIVEPDLVQALIFQETESIGRYILFSYMVAAFILALEITTLLKEKRALKCLGIFLSAIYMSLSISTYSLKLLGPQYVDCYRDSISVFTPDGKQSLAIQVGPNLFWYTIVRWDQTAYTLEEEPLSDYGIRTIQDKETTDVQVIEGEETTIFSLTGWAVTPDGQPFEHVFLLFSPELYMAPYARIENQDVSSRYGQPDSRYGFQFYVNGALLLKKNLEFVGITESGKMYKWTVEINAHY